MRKMLENEDELNARIYTFWLLGNESMVRGDAGVRMWYNSPYQGGDSE